MVRRARGALSQSISEEELLVHLLSPANGLTGGSPARPDLCAVPLAALRQRALNLPHTDNAARPVCRVQVARPRRTTSGSWRWRRLSRAAN